MARAKDTKTGMRLSYSQVVPQIPYRVAMGLRSMMARRRTRYGIDGMNVCSDGFTVTDGKRLLHITENHRVPPGTYKIGRDGWLCGPLDLGSFPEWRSVLLPRKKQRVIWEGDIQDPSDTAAAIWAISRTADTAMYLEIWFSAVKAIRALRAGRVTIACEKGKKKDSLIQIMGDMGDQRGTSFTYIQMPIAIDRKEK